MMAFMEKKKRKKEKKITSVGQNVEYLKLLYTVGGNVKQCSHYGNQIGDSSKEQQDCHITQKFHF